MRLKSSASCLVMSEESLGKASDLELRRHQKGVPSSVSVMRRSSRLRKVRRWATRCICSLRPSGRSVLTNAINSLSVTICFAIIICNTALWPSVYSAISSPPSLLLQLQNPTNGDNQEKEKEKEEMIRQDEEMM